MHAPVNGDLSMLHLFDNKQEWGGDKSADCLHCGAFSAGGET